MSGERITVSVSPDVPADARGAVGAGVAECLSALVADALRDRLRALTELARVLGSPHHGRRGPLSGATGAYLHHRPTRRDRRMGL